MNRTSSRAHVVSQHPFVHHSNWRAGCCRLIVGLSVVLAMATETRAELPIAGRPTVGAKQRTSLERLLKESSRGHRHQAISAGRMRTLQSLFERTIVAAPTAGPKFRELQTEWRDIGWLLATVDSIDETFLVVCQGESAKHGGGFYVIRPTAIQHVLLQAPHAYADLNTRSITLRLFENSSFWLAAWNTAHRDQIDVAHTRLHAFNAFMEAALAVRANALVLQLHGFSQQKRDTPAGASADLILSDGTEAPSRWVRNSAVLFQQSFADTTARLFPDEVRELGGLSNVQSDMLRQLSSRRFLHVEMSRPLRRRIVESETLRAELLKQLHATYRLSQR